MEFIQPVAQIIIDRLWDPTARRVNYFTKIGENLDNLRDKAKELKDLTVDLRREVERAILEGKDPTNEVQGWLQKADGIINNVEEMQEEFQRNDKCFFGWCLDCPSRYQLGKRIAKATQVVQDHRERKNRWGVIAVLPLPEHVSELPTTIIREKTSTMDALDQVWNWLMDAKTGRIGISGMGGVGKTTLMRNINNKLCRTRHFEEVIFVTVSRDWNIKKLRNDIGKALHPDEGRETWASTSLFNKLKGKRFLLILDDMWEKVDLDELGVPTPEQSRGCKIAITTRDRGVCHDMETDEEIMVEVLPDMEAWELFQEKAGSVISSDLEPIARDVCKECHGLPLAIIVVGRALRKEANREVWEYALRVLKTSQFELKGMEREVYSPLKFSYDHLETDTLQDCFLYCSLFPEDYLIEVDELIEYWIMEGFIEGVESLKDASAKGHYLLKELIDSCLLEKDAKEYFVKMHDVIRDMAIKITSEITDQRGKRFLVQAGVGLEECPKVEKWEGKDRISLMRNQIKSLPDEPESTELSTLLLEGNKFLGEISQSFFKQMENLRVLDLSGTSVVSLPPSISELRSLQALILRGCNFLKSVTHVGGLSQLQLLDLSYSNIVELPREIGQLTRLRRLGLLWTKLEHIPADTIVSLSLLEDLEMQASSYFRISDKGEALIENLRQLNHLSHFSAGIPNDLCTSSQWKFLLGNKLKTFHLLIGEFLFSERRRRGQYLDITRNGNVSQAVGLIQYAEILRLYCHNEVRTISAMGACNLKRLKGCFVRECNQLENVIITEEAEERILPNLEILVLRDLSNLRSIWKGNGTPPGSFGRIKNIILRNCDNMMHLFSSKVLQLLNSLEELKIISCPRMVEIVTGEVGNEAIALPKMRSILLYKLPKLNKMWEGILSLGSLREIEVTSCTSLRQLAIDIEKTPALEVIRGEREWRNGLEWQNESSKSHFQNKFKLVTHDYPDKYPDTDAELYFLQW